MEASGEAPARTARAGLHPRTAARGGSPPELYVDGTAPLRTELRRIVPQTLGGGFILQLSEYLQRRGLVALAFPGGISEADWNTALDLLSAPPVEESPAREGDRLAGALAERRITHVVVLREVDQIPASPTLDWQIRWACPGSARSTWW